jgi:hypothetical protein
MSLKKKQGRLLRYTATKEFEEAFLMQLEDCEECICIVRRG